MTRRIGLAQRGLNDPDLIILDEPTSGLDPIGIEPSGRSSPSCAQAHGHRPTRTSSRRCRRCATAWPILHRGQVLVAGALGDLLARPERWRLDVRGPAAPAAASVASALEPLGLRVEGVRPAAETLEELFIRTVEGKGAAR